MIKEKDKIKTRKKEIHRDNILGPSSHSTKKNLDFAIANKIINYLQQEEKF